MTQYSVKILSTKEIASNILEMRLERPKGFVYTAGQFIQILVPDNGKQTPRSYSLASAPTDPFLTLCVKLIPGGLASTFLSNSTEGASLDIRGPQGRFIVEPNKAHHTFVVTGAGLAPVISMVRDELQKRTEPQLTLLFGVRHKEDIFWEEELDVLSAQHENFSWTLSLSRPDPAWSGTRGRVTEHLDYVFSRESDYYLCGSGEMVRDVRTALIQKNVPPSAIHFEIF